GGSQCAGCSGTAGIDRCDLGAMWNSALADDEIQLSANCGTFTESKSIGWRTDGRPLQAQLPLLQHSVARADCGGVRNGPGKPNLVRRHRFCLCPENQRGCKLRLAPIVRACCERP